MTSDHPNPAPLLTVRDLAVWFSSASGGDVRAVDGVSFTVYPRQTLAIVGESGCGKSVTAMSLLRLLPSPPARYVRGSAVLNTAQGGSQDLLRVSDREIRAVRGGSVAMIFQEPMTSLNPVFTVGDQIAEAIRLHRDVSNQQARGGAAKALDDVGIPRARANSYPHEFSGGMRQRVMIAMALACRPQLLLADEPTTALDVTVQAQILDLIARMRSDLGTGVVLITHDLGIVAARADVVCVMYAGRVVEYADVYSIFERPRHPYTRGLLASIPARGRERLQTVDDFVLKRTELEIAGHGASLHAWWPAPIGTPHASAGYRLVEIEPGHWVAALGAAAADSSTIPAVYLLRDGDARQRINAGHGTGT